MKKWLDSLDNKQFGGNIIGNNSFVNPYTYNAPALYGSLKSIADSRMNPLGKGWHGMNSILQYIGQSKLEKEQQDESIRLSQEYLADNYQNNMFAPFYNQSLSLMQDGGITEDQDDVEDLPVESPSIFKLAGMSDPFAPYGEAMDDSENDDMFMNQLNTLNQESVDFSNEDVSSGRSDSFSGLDFNSSSNYQPDTTAKEVMDYYQNKHGLPKHVAAGITSNIKHESNFNTRVYGDQGTSQGLFQWRNERRTGLLNWAKSQGRDPYAMDTQLDYALVEAKQRGDLDRVMNTSSAGEAAYMWAKYFERPKVISEERSRDANALMSKQKGGVIVDPKGQWNHPGQPTLVPTKNGHITMKGVNYPVFAIDELGNSQLMQPNQDYQFPGKNVMEYPLKKNGGWLNNL